jgi:ferric-dicitrate binding protein FerR (iron transport regulator)
MTTNSRTSRILRVCLTLAVLAGMCRLALPAAGAQEQVGLLTVTGLVKVDGRPASSGDIVASGSEVQTAKGSSAVVSLGTLGRVEALLPSTTVKLRYDHTDTTHTPASVAILLSGGSIRVSTGEGTRFNVEAGTTSIRPTVRAQQNVFTVDRTCGSTLVAVEKGKVELRGGASVKQIDAGGQDEAGPARPGCIPWLASGFPPARDR